MPLVAYRVRVRNVADTADLVTFTGADLAAALAGDGAELDPITGEVRSGSYSVPIVDAGGPVRTLTRWLADAQGRWQLLSRRAICERSIDGGAWTVLLAGYVTRVAFADAITGVLEIGDRLRVPATARAFGTSPGFTQTRGCLIGGPVTATWGPLTYRGGWTYTVLTAGGVGRELVVECRESYGPPAFGVERGSAQWVDRINELAQPLLASARLGTGVAAGSLLCDDIITRIREDNTGTEWTGIAVALTSYNAATPVGQVTRLRLLETTQGGGGRARLSMILDGTNPMPAVGSRGRIDVTTRTATETCPIYVDERPFTFAANLLTGAGVAIDAAAFTAADALVGPLRLTFRITDTPTVADLIQRSVLQPLGFALITDAQGRLAPVRTRLALGEVSPVATLTANDVASIDTPWELDEATAVARYEWEMPEYVVGVADEGMDGVRTVTRRQIWEVGDLSTYATKTISIESAGMIRPPSAWTSAIEQISSRERGTLAQRYARGAAQTTLTLVRGTTATDAITLGSVVRLDLPWHPNRDRRHGEAAYDQRLAQVLRLTEGVATRTVLLEDLGPNATALTTLPTLSIAAGTGNARLEANVTISNAAALNAAGLGAEIQIAVTNGIAPVTGDWVTVATFTDGAVPTAIAHRTVLTVGGQRVWARARSLQRDRLPSAWTTLVDVTLSALVAPSSVAAAAIVGDGTRLTITWSRATGDGASLEVRVRETADATGVIRWADLLPPGSTAATAESLAAGTAYTVEVRAVQPVTGEVTAWVSATQTTDGAATTPATFAAVISGSNGRGTISARATMTGTPLADSADVEVAISTDGGVSFGPYESAGAVVPDPNTLQAFWLRSALPNNGWLYRTRMRQRRGTLTGAWQIATEDVNPWIRTLSGV